MRFSRLLSQLPAVDEASPCDLAADPEIGGAESLERAGADQLSFLEAGHASAEALDSTSAGALLLFPDPDLQARASARGLAWVAVSHPRLAFAEALEALFPRRRPEPGVHATAVISPEARVAADAHVGPHAVIGPGCVVLDGCVLHPGVVLLEDVRLERFCEIHANAVLHPGTRLGEGCVVHSGAVIGSEGFGFVPTPSGWRKMPQTGRVVLEAGVEVGCGSMVDRPAVGETRVGAGTKIDNLVHVGHGVTIGPGCALAAQVGLAGGARLGRGVILAGQVGVANRATLGDGAIASSKSGIHGDVPAGEVVSGYPAIPNRLWLRCSAAFSKLPEMARSLRQLKALQAEAASGGGPAE
jgi:UDP-3-O-[3-hydroxymyristoyl] glucosamine N-acyltransferase